ncbi:MAG: PilT/PilU family type 4a pilus ATPase, partial [Myxococcales bacterium]|nr:PilT/PilU family type 4a pilus ATPase [Myxococcales bacterium]
MSSSRPVPLLGRIAIHLKMITHDQLAVVTRQQERDGHNQNLGDLMVECGYLNAAQLKRLVAAQKQVIAKQRASDAVATADAEPEVAPTSARSAPKPAAAPVARTDSRTPAASPAPTPATEPSLFDDPPPAARAPAGETPAPAATPAVEPSPAPAPEAAPAPTTSPASSGGLDDLLRAGVAKGASDIHIHSGLPMRLRLHGQFVAGDDTAIPPAEAAELVRSALTMDQRARLDAAGELDFAYRVRGLGRFRANVFRQQGGTDGVFRHIPDEAPTLEELGLPGTLARFTNFHQGLVLITGPANCGKSSTMAAMVRILNEERRDHILTIEDPIEYVHKPDRCVVNQRSVGPHTESFPRALRAALREDPDVIVIGELRDLETISLALTAAETGHLVLGTLHTNNTIRTLNRLVGVFPADQQDQIRNMVSESLRAVVSQRLVRTVAGDARVPALEV